MRFRFFYALTAAASLAAVTPAARGFAQESAARRPVAGAPSGVIAFVDVNVIPMDVEQVLAKQTVLVEEGWITRLGPSSQVPVPAGALRIDGQGKYLIPGLADMHVHLVMGRKEVFDNSAMERMLMGYVANGVTTVRNMDHMPVDGTSDPKGTAYPEPNVNVYPKSNELVLQLRARAAVGKILSPRIYTAGPWYAYGGRPMDPDQVPLGEVARRVAAYKAAGYDFVKPYWEEPAVFDSVAAAARRLGLPMAGHLPKGVLERGKLAAMKSTEHMQGYLPRGAEREALYGKNDPPASLLAALSAKARNAGIWICPTLVTISLDVQRIPLAKAMHDSGVGILLGTDGKSLPRELQNLVEKLQLTPYQALATGTRNPAAYFGMLDSIGTVAMGKRADLVLLDANPLENVRHIEQPAGVMMGGRWLSRAELDRHLAEAPRAETDQRLAELPRMRAPRPTSAPISAEDLMTRLYIFAADSMEGRKYKTAGNVKGTKYLAAELKKLGLEPGGDNGTYFQTLPYNPKVGEHPPRNVIAILRGTDPTLNQTYVAIGSHNDHVGISDRGAVDHDSLRAFKFAEHRVLRAKGSVFPGDVHVNIDSLRRLRPVRRDSIYNGADDDGSGSVAVLEIAEALAKLPAKPKRSILFILHTGEEYGLLGSEHFMRHPTVPRDSIITYVNLDMVGRGRLEDTRIGGPDMLMVIGSRLLSTELGDLVDTVNTRQGHRLRLDYSNDVRGPQGRSSFLYDVSDHASYDKHHIPIVFFFTGAHADYHQVADEPQYIDYPHLTKITKYVYDLMLALGDRPRRLVVDQPLPKRSP